MKSKFLPIVAAVLAFGTPAAHAADLAPPTLDILSWPRMQTRALGCLMESLGHRDPRFNCALAADVPPGDPCDDIDAYYAGPVFPPALAARVHPLASKVALEFEHGQIRWVEIQLKGRFTEREVREAFALPADDARPNIMSVHVEVTESSTSVTLIGFEHMGSGDVNCPKK
jgi:hypothetical protein